MPGLAEAILEAAVDVNVEVELTIGLQDAIEATGVENLVDVSMLDVSDFPQVSDQVANVLRRLFTIATNSRSSWLREVTAAPALLPPQLPEPIQIKKPAVVLRSAKAVAQLALRTATAKSGHEAVPATPSMKDINHGKISSFLDKAHAFFLRYLADSPRAIEINAAPDEDKQNFLEVQRKCYIARSQSVQYMNTRLRHAEIIAKELVAQNIDYRDLTPVRVAAYINKRTVGLSHDKAYNLSNTVRSALRWLEEIAGTAFFGEHRLVKDQERCAHKGTRSVAKHAIVWTEDMIMGFEGQAGSAPTPQLRCFAGACAMMAHASHRALDGLRIRHMEFSEHALHGQALIKNKHVWENWAVTIQGFADASPPWTRVWWQQLQRCGLPGCDYLLNGCNEAFDAWKPVPATTSTMEDALRILLQLPPHSMSPAEAALHTMHGARSTYVTALTQLGASTGTLEKAGRWTRGSAMPERYDSRANVAQLKLRSRVAAAVAKGWRMAPAHCIPAPDPAHARKKQRVDFKYVVHSIQGKYHVLGTNGRAVCGWKTGTSDSPTKYAVHMQGKPDSFVPCGTCCG